MSIHLLFTNNKELPLSQGELSMYLTGPHCGQGGRDEGEGGQYSSPLTISRFIYQTLALSRTFQNKIGNDTQWAD